MIKRKSFQKENKKKYENKVEFWYLCLRFYKKLKLILKLEIIEHFI